MDNKEAFRIFYETFTGDLPPYLEKIREEAENEGIPVIRRSEEGILSFFASMKPDADILELGTAVGFSALLLWEASGKRSRITTIENYEPRIIKAEENIRAAGADKHIDLRKGDATDILKELKGGYDLVFMDAAKGQYETWLKDIIPLLNEGAFLISDNILKESEIMSPRYAVKRRDRTIHTRMRSYLRCLFENERFDTILIENGDGMAVSRYKGIKPVKDK